MTVKELIEILNGIPSDASVMFDGGSTDPIDVVDYYFEPENNEVCLCG